MTEATNDLVSRDLVMRKRISWKNMVGMDVLLLIVAVVISLAGYQMGWPVPLPLLILGSLAPFLIGLIIGWLMRISTEYRVYEDSLEVESGIIARNIDNIQLFRVRDLGLSQGILGRILNFGSVAVSSTDQSAPHLLLKGVDDPRGLYDALRSLVAKSQAARRTMIVEDGIEHSAPLESG